MLKKMNKKGFTLAELLIVVAIIGVLVAVSIPIFTAQLNKAKYATDEANARAIYAELTADYLSTGGAAQNNGAGTYRLSATSVSENNQITITTTSSDGTSTNSYKFSGIVAVTIVPGTTSAAPSVTVSACSKAGVSDPVTFGKAASTGGSGTGTGTGSGE